MRTLVFAALVMSAACACPGRTDSTTPQPTQATVTVPATPATPPAPPAETVPATPPAPPPEATPPAPPAPPAQTQAPVSTTGGQQGTPCQEGKCAAGLSCVSYYGIAGPRGPQFTSCEIPCPTPESKCPSGQQCVTIADGPGRVCRGK